MEYRLRRQDGQYRWMLENGFLILHKTKYFQASIGSCVDMNEIKEMEKRKDQFITAASHELKTPLTSLKVYLHLYQNILMTMMMKNMQSMHRAQLVQAKKINGSY